MKNKIIKNRIKRKEKKMIIKITEEKKKKEPGVMNGTSGVTIDLGRTGLEV